VAAAYGVSRSWIYELLARYRAEGEAAFEPRSRRPKTSPRAIPAGTAAMIVSLRKELAGHGLDTGPDTICWHLDHHHRIRVSPATVSRYLARAGLVVPEPTKRPKSSYIRFAAELPNQCWQAGFTHYPLADGMVFTTRLSGGRGGRNAFEHELRRLGVTQKNGKPSHRRPRAKRQRPGPADGQGRGAVLCGMRVRSRHGAPRDSRRHWRLRAQYSRDDDLVGAP